MGQMDDLKVVIFDLDGTLYQDESFLERYLRELLTGVLPDKHIEKTVDEAYDILTGKHPLIPFGSFYQPEERVILTHEQMKLKNAYMWHGKWYKGCCMCPSNMNTDDLHYIGDPWCIAGLYIYLYDIKTHHQCFERVRKEMLTTSHAITRYEPLFEAIAELPVEKKVLLTNSPQATAEEFIDYLGAKDLFDDVVLDAKKPRGMKTYVDSLINNGYSPESILSIGDNPWNDLYPLKTFGGKTCLISKYTHQPLDHWDITVSTVEELAVVLQKIKTTSFSKEPYRHYLH